MHRPYTLFLLAAFTIFCSSISFAANLVNDVETIEQELNQLESQIDQHLNQVKGNSFFKDEPNPATFLNSATANNFKPANKLSNPRSVQQSNVNNQVATQDVGTNTINIDAPAKKLQFGPPSGYGPAPGTGPLTHDLIDADSRVRVSGSYRMAFGVGRNRTFSINDSNSDLQDRDFHYLFGERLNNTFDPAIYSQFLTNIDADITDGVSVFAQIAADPWSYVGQTSEIEAFNGNAFPFDDSIRVKQKYWGPNNSTIGQIVRSRKKNSVVLPDLEVDSGHTQAFRTGDGFDNFIGYDVPEQDIDYEFRPLRKAWVDYEGDIWKARIFPLADQQQAMRTDDPLGLSGTIDFWQPSAWIDQWRPIMEFSDNSIRRGTYTDAESFQARHSNGDYLTLLRGASLEVDFGRTYLGGMIASRFGLWDDYTDINNVPGVIRMKHMLTPQLMVGGVYGFRIGMIDREPDAYSQVIGVDTKYYINPGTFIYGEIAGSRNEIDRLSDGNAIAPEGFKFDFEGQAYKGGFKTTWLGHTKVHGDFTWMDSNFYTPLSKYTALRDDEHWGKYATFMDHGGLEPFRIGTGVDRGRYTARISFHTSKPDTGLTNLLDIRHVRNTNTNGFMEHVMRNELEWQMTPTLKGLAVGRWHVLPKTETDVEPFMSSFIAGPDMDPNLLDTKLLNFDVDPDLDPSRFTIGGGFQFAPNETWIFEGIYMRTNDIPDFPRGLQNGTFLNSNLQDSEEPNVLLDRTQPFLYGQNVYDLPPYKFFSIVKERIHYRHSDELSFTFHAAQNSYKLWAPIDENMNHQGISVDWQINDRMNFFGDYTHSKIADVPRLINTQFTELNFRDHHNFYGNLSYKVTESSILNIEYGVYGTPPYAVSEDVALNPFVVSSINLPVIDTEHLFRVSLEGEF